MRIKFVIGLSSATGELRRSHFMRASYFLIQKFLIKALAMTSRRPDYPTTLLYHRGNSIWVNPPGEG